MTERTIKISARTGRVRIVNEPDSPPVPIPRRGLGRIDLEVLKQKLLDAGVISSKAEVE